MILDKEHSSEYLKDYYEGKIEMGKGLGIALDKNLVWKRGELNIILGHDNVGKSYFFFWYALALSVKHGLTFCLFADENSSGKIMRDLIQMYVGKKFQEIPFREMRKAEYELKKSFKFIDNKQRYTPSRMLELFKESGCDNLLIDPFNALHTPFTYSDNIDVLNEIKMFTKVENKTIWINAHPASASGRRGAVFPKDHMWANHVMPPLKSDCEGGKIFANKCDTFIIVHRLTGHPDLWYMTMIEVAKVKDTDTGSKCTMLDQPVMLDYNHGLGFTCGGINPLKHEVHGDEVWDRFYEDIIK